MSHTWRLTDRCTRYVYFWVNRIGFFDLPALAYVSGADGQAHTVPEDGKCRPLS